MNQKEDMDSTVSLFANLPVSKARFRVKLTEEADFPPYTGSMWRGLIGWEMQKLICPFHMRSKCGICTINEHCPYYLMFEQNTTVSGLSESPRGYVVYPVGEAKGFYELYVTLIGKTSAFFSVISKAVLEGQKTGLGKDRHPYRVLSVEEFSPNTTSRNLQQLPEGHFEAPDSFALNDWIGKREEENGPVKVKFLTPLRLRKKGKYLSKPDFPFFFETMIRRLEALHCIYHDGEPLGKETFLTLRDNLQIDGNPQSDLRWWDFKRYSNRQRKKVPLGGLVGEATFTDLSSEHKKWLKAAELLHVGKGVAMGLGKIQIV